MNNLSGKVVTIEMKTAIAKKIEDDGQHPLQVANYHNIPLHRVHEYTRLYRDHKIMSGSLGRPKIIDEVETKN